MPITLTFNAPKMPEDDNQSVQSNDSSEGTQSSSSTSSASSTSSTSSSILGSLSSSCRQLGGAMARALNSMASSAVSTARNLGARAITSYRTTQLVSVVSRLTNSVPSFGSNPGPRGPEVTVSYSKEEDKVTFHDPYNRDGFSSTGSGEVGS